MGRRKGTLICPKCRRQNSESSQREMHGCHNCGYKFPQDSKKEACKVKR